jgi:hypothetical protein
MPKSPRTRRFPRMPRALAQSDEPARERILARGFFKKPGPVERDADVLLLPVFFTSTSKTGV